MSTQSSPALTFSIEKAPLGGYTMRLGSDPERAAAARSSLPELMELIHAQASERYGEAAWYPPRQSYVPPPAPAAGPEHDIGDMPRMVQEFAEGGGMMGELQRRVNGVIRAIVPALFFAGVWLSANLRPLVT